MEAAKLLTLFAFSALNKSKSQQSTFKQVMKKSNILIITLIAISALSLSFVSNRGEKPNQKLNHATPVADTPVGGFAIDNQIEN